MPPEPRKPTILVVDDVADFVQTVREKLKRAGYDTLGATGATETRAVLDTHFVDLLLLDERLGGYSGTKLMQDCRRLFPSLAGILVSGYADLPMAVEAMRAGAIDLLTKENLEEKLLPAVERALDQTALVREARLFRWTAARETVLPNVIGRSAALRKVAEQVRRVAPHDDISVLIVGETGSGKDLIAHALHDLSPRAKGPFLALNAAAIPRELIESMLFGAKRGAYTGAVADMAGHFEAAHKGTLFLDEIGETAPELQARLLRVLEEKKVTRLGDTRQRDADVRVIAATNRNIREQVENGKFREDFYHRLAGITIQMPPLRDRIEDIEPLARHFIRRFARVHPDTGITPAAVAKLRGYHWPGNVRELQRVIKSAIVFADSDTLDVGEIQFDSSMAQTGVTAILEQPLRDATLDFERLYFTRLLQRTGGNKSKAAQMAGVERSVLYAHLEKIGFNGDPDSK